MPTRPTSPDPSGDSARPSAFGSLGAGLDFFQDWLKAAGSALPNMPGQSVHPGIGNWAMPTLDPEELDKRIQDLKTVQFWLEQNTRMVAMTIQGLEVQKMTLSTLKGMNVSMDSLRDALKARNAAADMASAAARAAPPPAPAPAPPPEAQASAHGSDDPPARANNTDDATAGNAELINPMRWWDTLTEQFTHLASQASQTAQTVGTSMSDLLAQTQQAANAAAAQHAPPATAGKASSGTTRNTPASPAARKTARKTARASSSTSAPTQAKRAPKG